MKSKQKNTDPRDPIRIIIEIEKDPDGGPTFLVLSCRHRVERVNHFSYLIGGEEHCRECKRHEAFLATRLQDNKVSLLGNYI